MATNHLNFRLPAEWEPQDAIMLAWPHTHSDWQYMLSEVKQTYLDLTRQLVRFERVIIVTPEPDSVAQDLRQAGISTSAISIYDVPTNDTWARDFGPVTVFRENGPVLLDFGFNGWGLKFAANHDNRITRRLHQQGCFGSTPLETIGLVLEGGSIESDGNGTLLTTSECLLNPNRNPQLDISAIQKELFNFFGSDHILWLDHGHLAGDDTDSHIDTLARLCPDDTILYVSCNDSEDEHYAALTAMKKQLQKFRTRTGSAFRLLPLPWPEPCFDGHQRLPATYANYLVVNNAVLVPTYADSADSKALQVIGQAFPGRQIIGIDCRSLIRQHGSLHCITMQIPEGVLR